MSISPKALQALKYIFAAGGKATERTMHEDIGPLTHALLGELFPKYVGINQRSGTLYLTAEGREHLDIHPKTSKRTAVQHMVWCKERALEYVKKGALRAAVASMSSDLREHQETADQPSDLMVMGMTLIGAGEPAVRRWIEGFAVGKPHIDMDKVDAVVNREFTGRTPRRPHRFEGGIAASPVGQNSAPYSRGAEVNLCVRDLTVHGVWDLSYRIRQFERFTPEQIEDAFTGGPFSMLSTKGGELVKKRRAERRTTITETAKMIADAIIKQIEDAEGWPEEEERHRARLLKQRDADTIDLNREKEPKA